jgi:hypothetical protein
MVNKTVKHRQKRRAKTHKRRGGAIDKLPDIKKGDLVDFNNNWDVIYIRAHGLLLDSTFEVPPDKYILNSVPSTQSCYFPVDSPVLDGFYTDDFGTDFMEFIANPRVIFRNIYSPSMVGNLRKKGESSPVTSIYEPGDVVNDVLLQFESHVVAKNNIATKGITHFIVPGIFKLPIPNFTKHLRDTLIRRVRSRLSMNNEALKGELMSADDEFIRAPGNLLTSIVARNRDRKDYNLTELLSMPELQPADGKKLFVIVHACKSSHSANNVKARIRRASVNRILASENRRAAPSVGLSDVPPPPLAADIASSPPVAPKSTKPKGAFGFKTGFLLSPPKSKP